jgi:hypothetical protein
MTDLLLKTNNFNRQEKARTHIPCISGPWDNDDGANFVQSKDKYAQNNKE